MSDDIVITEVDRIGRNWTIRAARAVKGFRYTVWIHHEATHEGLDLLFPGGVAHGWTEHDHWDEPVRVVLRAVALSMGTDLGSAQDPDLVRDRMLRQQAEIVCERRTRERDEARAALEAQAIDVARGRALTELGAQIERLRRTTPEQTPFDFDPESVAKVVIREVSEVLAEDAGSIAARRECADVIAGALHLLIVHGGNPVEALAGVAAKLRARLDLVDQGLTWDEAKSRLGGTQ